MSRRRGPRLDLGEILLVAAAVGRTDTADLCRHADITLLALISGRAAAAAAPAEAIAELLVGIAAGRPFPTANTATAWALAAQLADAHRSRIDLPVDDAAALVRSAASGGIDEATVAARIASALVPQRSPAPATIAPAHWACPRCGRAVLESPYRSSIMLAEPHPDDVVADCARVHRAHGPAGAIRRYDAVERIADAAGRSVKSTNAGTVLSSASTSG